MWSRNKSVRESTSTPKRRRLGTDRILRPNLQVFDKEYAGRRSPYSRPDSPFDDPPLPCNQIEYLCDSGNTSTSSDIPCSPGVVDSSIIKSVQKWESLTVSRDLSTIIKKATDSVRELDEIEDISDEMFYSRLEQSSHCDHIHNNVSSTCNNNKNYSEDIIEESFDAINQSINELNKANQQNNDKNSLFETKDSFLLDIKESGIIKEAKEKPNAVPAVPSTKQSKENELSEKENFYGLPIVTKSLFKSYRNIEKFYDWQEECLNLPAIKERRNLIYALPTSGGKTLVAEVLMLREVLCRKKNALFILPFVAIVQEKIWALSPFAVQLEFLVEEYAAGKGHIPPKKRRKKNSIYVATIEKGLVLIRSLIEENRLDELGLIVVDELHLIGEPGRGASLEMLLTTVLFANKGIQVVGMSATIGNLPELGAFLHAEVFQRDFRPVELAEYVKLGDVLHRITWTQNDVEIVPARQLDYDYSSAGASLDPDRLGGLVSEVVPNGSCLVFCPTKRNCENVAALLCKLLRKEMLSHRGAERASLCAALAEEGSSGGLRAAARCGVAYHHAGLASDERGLLEHAFRAGVISVLCCTSTLAAGVNLPARRVIVRAPRVGRDLISLGAYRQMAGRAGRAGVCDSGESIILCPVSEWAQLQGVLRGGLRAAHSVLRPRAAELLLSAVTLRLATTRPRLKDLLDCTLLATDSGESTLDTKQVCDDALTQLLQSSVLEVVHHGPAPAPAPAPCDRGGAGAGGDQSRLGSGSGSNSIDTVVYNDSELVVSALGRAAVKGCMELSVAKQLFRDLETASRSLVLLGSLHLLHLVSPIAASSLRPDYRHYYSLYCNLDEEGIQTARVLGITEVNAIRMMTGKPITNVPESVLRRFYVALLLRDLWHQLPPALAADKYCMSTGAVQSALVSAAAFAQAALRFCEELPALWPLRALLADLAPRLHHCALPELRELMELPNVRKARAMQLLRAGYKRIEDVARADVEGLTAAADHLSRSAASHLISAARMMLIEKVENLRAEAEMVMEELNI